MKSLRGRVRHPRTAGATGVRFSQARASGELHQLALRQAAEIERLERELRARGEFLAMLTHECKNGLTGMAGFAEMIRDFGLEPEAVHQYAGDILNEAHRMSRMLGELLQLARFDAGQVPLQLSEVDINDLIRPQVRLLLQTRAGFTFCAGSVPAVVCDADRVTQVIANLLSNALKYSPDGGAITVRSGVVDGMAEVSVSDHGLGIPAGELDLVFERFHRVETGAAARVNGTGLGLAISREIVERLGGTIRVESKLGEGSTFAFTLPLAQPATGPGEGVRE